MIEIRKWQFYHRLWRIGITFEHDADPGVWHKQKRFGDAVVADISPKPEA